MLIYDGIAALTDFQKKKLLKNVRKLDNAIEDVSAEFVHFVDSGKLNTDEHEQLRTILSYGTPFVDKPTKKMLLVVPRPGTISPWSSKATDIAHNSGLTKVRRIERGIAYYFATKQKVQPTTIAHLLHDRMIEAVFDTLDSAKLLFRQYKPKSFKTVDVLKGGASALDAANKKWGLALAPDEIEYLVDAYKNLGRNPSDAELMMFGVVNSEHCRHKIFNADWIIDGEPQPKSLFKMIKNTYEKNSKDVLSAYSDNAAVLNGAVADRYFADPKDNVYRPHREAMPLVIKAETHNHPTAIAPFPGAATGTGGEIRDEAATGRGAKSKMGMTGFTVSNLNLPRAKRAWEKSYGKPNRIMAPLDIMIDAPLGGAAFANEFGRVNLAGYFRTYEQKIQDDVLGYHKPLMIAGGLGNIRTMHIKKQKLKPGDKLLVLGGPAMLIGLGGGAASSMQTGTSEENLDFASVQRGNGEMERRAQEVINTCWAMGAKNPISMIHDVGAGGLSNAFPELVHDSGLGGTFEIRNIPNDEPGMSPMEIWCNESQERYVLGIRPENLALFKKICERERCPVAVVGAATQKRQLVLRDKQFANKPIDIPMELLFGKPPKMTKKVERTPQRLAVFETKSIKISDAVERVLQLPAVGSKKFLITIGDRTVGGLTARDQMVGPWQVPVSDVAVTMSSFGSKTGEALSMGERPALAIINSPASARMAVGEALTNIAAARIARMSDVKLSANWMAASGYKQEDEKLYDAVKAIGEEFCPQLGITIPVGKDSLSMRTVWDEDDKPKSVTSPLSLIVTAFSPVANVAQTLTPELKSGSSSLLLVDLGQGKNRLGGSALAQVYNQLGNEAPDIEAGLLKKFFASIQELNRKDLLLAYHDRSDGGLLATVLEMAFASRSGLDLDVSKVPGDGLSKLFSEELGAVIQVRTKNAAIVQKMLKEKLGNIVHNIGMPSDNQKIVIKDGNKTLYKNTRGQLEQLWADTSYRIQSLRDNATLARQEFTQILDDKDPGISPVVTFNSIQKKYQTKPKVAILREQGVNGQVEMAAAFDRAGFTAVDVHLNDLIRGQQNLKDFAGLVACGGFSYGDVLGAGEGWAKTILFNEKLRKQFVKFFERSDTFSLGVCNGCQMLSQLKELIPGAEHWPRFLQNNSARFEARFVTVQVNKSPSIFFTGMEGSRLPIPVAHGEGRAEFDAPMNSELISLQYVDNYGQPTQQYPYNPNGSKRGVTGFTTTDGRATIMMPHPERAFLTSQHSWHPEDWKENGPWLRMFQNARAWVEENK